MAARGGQSREEDRTAVVAVAEAEAEAGLEFCCKYCDRKFKNKHALGGHQNAHRLERAMDWTARRSRRGRFMNYYPFSPFAGFPLLPAAAAAGGGQMNYWNQAASMPPYFLPASYPIPLPEIPARPPPYAYPFPPAVPETSPLPSLPPVENHPPLTQVLPPPAMTIPGANNFPAGSVPANSSVTPMLGSNPMNTPEIIEDGELDMTLKL